MKYILSTILLIFSGYAWTCSCMFYDGSVEEQVNKKYNTSDSVVFAQVEGVKKIKIKAFWNDHDEEANGEETHFSVIKSWKGSHAKHFYTKIITDCCVCGITFKEGEKYLLYLSESEDKGYYETSICAGNKTQNKAQKEIKVLDKLAPSKLNKRNTITGTS